MTISAPPETYQRLIEYGIKKVQLRLDQLFLQSVAAGFWVALYGHLCTVIGSALFSSNPGMAGVLYGVFFPGAFIAIIVSGSELFTGNTVTMVTCFLDKKCTILQLLRVWGVSLLGNFVGTTFMAAVLSMLVGAFDPNTEAYAYLEYLAIKKVNYGWGEALLLGIGCNSMVCLALWAVVCSNDGAGKYIALWFPIAAFAAGGFEHVIANFYTLQLAVFKGVPNISYGEIWGFNLVPVLLGNILAGTVFTGTLWWYNFHPRESELERFTEEEIIHELVRRTSKDITSKRASKVEREVSLQASEGLSDEGF
eukprot:GHVP01056328.1.p1 GENE.GHVP01056328.1~~GHVP01056328.1.p1  ORF type:complete len:337 (+),score=45.87 GHVP01056328.1:86-1012(+)